MIRLILAITVFILVAIAWIGKPYIANYFTTTPSTDNLPNKNFIIVGHRGAAGHAPENTLASFRKAIELGADWVELDVHLSKDGYLMVMHDPTVDRTTNGSGAIADLTYDEIRKLDAGSWFGPAFTGEKVPSLSEVIREINGEVKLLIELKWPEKGVYDGLGKMVADEVYKYRAENWCILQSFESRYLEEAASQGYSLPQQKLLVGKTSFLFMPMYQDNSYHMGSLPLSPEIESVNYYHKLLTKNLVEEHHATGKMVIPYTLNKREEMVKVLGMGADGVITDFPDLAKVLREELQHSL